MYPNPDANPFMAPRFQPRTSCAQGSCKKSISLVPLALFCVMVHGLWRESPIFNRSLAGSQTPTPGCQAKTYGALMASTGEAHAQDFVRRQGAPVGEMLWRAHDHLFRSRIWREDPAASICSLKVLISWGAACKVC